MLLDSVMHRMRRTLEGGAVSALFRLGVLTAVMSPASLMSADAERIPVEALSAGTFTVARSDDGAYAEPAPVLDYRQRTAFDHGRGHFHRRWVVFAGVNGDWGLGPTFVADRCSACHAGAGRGAPPAATNQQLRSMIVRLSLPGTDDQGGPRPDPNYGDQLQNDSLQGRSADDAYSSEPVPPEADLFIQWTTHTVGFADGESVELRQPRLHIDKLRFGPFGDGAMTSLRNAQPLIGLGLLEAIPEETLRAIAQAQVAQGMHGRPNEVWDALGGRRALGRFGWKANQPSLKQQIAAAAIGDMGVTSELYQQQNCPPVQLLCLDETPGAPRELIDSDWQEMEFWLQGLAVPARRAVTDPAFVRGEALFAEAKCAVCHVPELRTAAKVPHLPQLANQMIRPYTDLLLHDMGDDLADGRPDFAAGPRDWRTPPLWGLGLSKTVNGSTALLHDGRARNVTEAILWHGGEAEVSRERFQGMPKGDREALIRFVESI
jgi:CxxC motif-containing protein (DUF1111 family)